MRDKLGQINFELRLKSYRYRLHQQDYSGLEGGVSSPELLDRQIYRKIDLDFTNRIIVDCRGESAVQNSQIDRYKLYQQDYSGLEGGISSPELLDRQIQTPLVGLQWIARGSQNSQIDRQIDRQMLQYLNHIKYIIKIVSNMLLHYSYQGSQLLEQEISVNKKHFSKEFFFKSTN